jgi:folate/biopterin transporter
MASRSYFEVEGAGRGGNGEDADPLMQPEGLPWKKESFQDPIPNLRAKDARAPGEQGERAAPGGNDDSMSALLLESGFFPQGGKGPQISTLFYFITCWIFFVQGISSMSDMAVSYFYKDTLKTDPATLSTVTSLTALPWTIKPLYGFLSDGWPIFGYRRKPYIIIAGAVGSVSWFCMAVFVNDVWFGFACMFFGSMALSVCNVIAEGMLVEKSRGQTQEFASQLQAFVHGAQAVGGIIAAYFGGFLLSYLADRHMFMLCCLFPLTFVIVAFMIEEERFDGDVTAIRQDMAGKLLELWEAFKHPQIFKPVLFVFMLNATPATGATWFYFYTNTLHFSSSFMGTINVVGAICSLGGVVIFGKFLANTPFRPILIWSTIISTVFGLTQLILVFRWNAGYIPDGAFCVGESAILAILGWINTMPILVLAARLCPIGMEATMYALIMSINNLGGVVGGQFGAAITLGLGITENNLDNFWILVLICNLSTVLPLVFIGWIPADGEDHGAEITVTQHSAEEKQRT